MINMLYSDRILERNRCWECKKTSLHTVYYSDKKSEAKRICPLCKHISFWSIYVFPNPSEKNTDKQIDYVVNEIQEIIDFRTEKD